MMRTIRAKPAIVEPVSTDMIDNTHAWLQTKATSYNLCWMLAHLDDGVNWGKVDNGRLLTSHSVAPHISPPMRLHTLQTVRLFALQAELLPWRDGDNAWHARLIRDATTGELGQWGDAFDEPQILWGTDPQPLANGFTAMGDGAQGLRHAVPLHITGGFDEQTRPLRLWVRHYMQDDENGFCRIVASRLFDLKSERSQ